ncbi:DUF4190 domain-containing protein [Agromyces allii]|uniref:DUF4190 domain-containing protein n=1 Tax=Agromyces allii TaxID=393607 RepID=A0ABN2RFV4_9MICO|nr:DUF4190 domain-containing protein [Agromyces allii]
MDAPTPTPIPVAPAAPPSGVLPTGAAPYGAPALPPATPYGVAPAWAPPTAAPHNVLAWVALGLGVGSLMFGLLASIAAIVCGHIARRQIRERGEQGGAAALTGLLLGYILSGLFVVGFVLYLLFILVMVGVGAGSASSGFTSL